MGGSALHCFVSSLSISDQQVDPQVLIYLTSVVVCECSIGIGFKPLVMTETLGRFLGSLSFIFFSFIIGNNNYSTLLSCHSLWPREVSGSSEGWGKES